MVRLLFVFIAACGLLLAGCSSTETGFTCTACTSTLCAQDADAQLFTATVRAVDPPSVTLDAWVVGATSPAQEGDELAVPGLVAGARVGDDVLVQVNPVEGRAQIDHLPLPRSQDAITCPTDEGFSITMSDLTTRATDPECVRLLEQAGLNEMCDDVEAK